MQLVIDRADVNKQSSDNILVDSVMGIANGSRLLVTLLA